MVTVKCSTGLNILVRNQLTSTASAVHAGIKVNFIKYKSLVILSSITLIKLHIFFGNNVVLVTVFIFYSTYFSFILLSCFSKDHKLTRITAFSKCAGSDKSKV